jgi:hypothetical protein
MAFREVGEYEASAEAKAIPHGIAAVLLHLRDETQAAPAK